MITVTSKYPKHVAVPTTQCIRCGDIDHMTYTTVTTYGLISYCKTCKLVRDFFNNTFYKPRDDVWAKDNIHESHESLLGTPCFYCHTPVTSLVRTSFADNKTNEGICHTECLERRDGSLCNCGHLEIEHYNGCDEEEETSTCDRDGCTCGMYNPIGKKTEVRA